MIERGRFQLAGGSERSEEVESIHVRLFERILQITIRIGIARPAIHEAVNFRKCLAVCVKEIDMIAPRRELSKKIKPDFPAVAGKPGWI